MSVVWKRFCEATNGPGELSAIMFLMALIAPIVAIALLARLLSSGRYMEAIASVLAVSATAAVCSRDYRQRRWSPVSVTVMVLWLLTAAALGLLWIR